MGRDNQIVIGNYNTGQADLAEYHVSKTILPVGTRVTLERQLLKIRL